MTYREVLKEEGLLDGELSGWKKGEMLQEDLELGKKFYRFICNSYNNMGIFYQKKGKIEESIKCFTITIEIGNSIILVDKLTPLKNEDLCTKPIEYLIDVILDIDLDTHFTKKMTGSMDT